MKQKMSKAVTCLLSLHLLRRGPRVVGRWSAFFSKDVVATDVPSR